jgi:hypothetical protein
MLQDIELGKDFFFFLDMTPKAKVNKWDYFELRSFYRAKETTE